MLDRIDIKEFGKHVVFIVCVGFASAAASIILCLCVETAFHVNQMFAWSIFFLPLLGVLSLLVYRAMKLPHDYATDTMVDQMRANEVVSPTLAPGILIGTCLSILGGATVGKESGALQMGASISETMGRAFNLKNVVKAKQDVPLYGYAALLGMSATFSALFFAPLGAVFMVLELTHYKNFSIARFVALVVSSSIAAAIAQFTGIGDIIPKVAIPAVSADYALQVLLVGLVCGVLGSFHGRAMHVVRVWRETHVQRPYASVIVAGCVIAFVLFFFDLRAFEGSGMDLLAKALGGSIGTFDFAIKAFLMFVALSFGFKGGEIMPTLTIGGLLGCSLGQVVGVDPAFMAAIGVITFYVGFSRCPLAGFFLGVEIFGWATAPFMAIGVFVAWIGGRDLGFYGHGLCTHAQFALFEQGRAADRLSRHPKLERAARRFFAGMRPGDAKEEDKADS